MPFEPQDVNGRGHKQTQAALQRNTAFSHAALLTAFLLASAPQETFGGGFCEPIAGLTECETDDDCIVVDGVDCCSCTMGGQQAAINRRNEIEISLQREACCEGIACIALYACDRSLAAICEDRTCRLSRRPTPTPSPVDDVPGATPEVMCPGDCNTDGSVRVDELVTCVTIALGMTPASTCRAADVSGNEIVSVDEIVRAVDMTLDGCPPAGGPPLCRDSAGCVQPLNCIPGEGDGICFGGPVCQGFAGFTCPPGLTCLGPSQCCDFFGVCVTQKEADRICNSAAARSFDCEAVRSSR